MQIETGLPKEKILSVKIIENNEFLIEIKETEKIKLLKAHKYLYPFVRKEVQNKLEEASTHLPSEYSFLIVTCYRSIQFQKEMYRQRQIQMAIRHPFLMLFNFTRWKSMVDKFTAPPGGSSHQTGAAIDLTLINKKGERLDMGTSLTDFGEKVYMHTNLINEEQKKNRKTLRDAMTKAGFVYYPLEWWHYCYGDRMWAAYNNKTECFYGPLNI